MNKLLKIYRNELGLSQTEVARFFHVTQATVARWEYKNGSPLIPNDAVDILYKIIAICHNNRLKDLFMMILRGPDGFEACHSLINLIEAEFTDENLTSSKVRIKENAVKSINAFAKEIKMSNRLANSLNEFRVQDNTSNEWPLKTHGFRDQAKAFNFSYDGTTKAITIIAEHGRTDVFSLNLISQVLTSLYEQFLGDEFPLANNVAHLSKGTERVGLGSTIYKFNGKDTKNAQAASYLGPLLESLSVLEWNGLHRGIKWKFLRKIITVQELEDQLSKLLMAKGTS